MIALHPLSATNLLPSKTLKPAYGIFNIKQICQKKEPALEKPVKENTVNSTHTCSNILDFSA